jgi:hypothetical protein
MAEIPRGARVVRRDQVVANDLADDETVMLDIEQGTYFGVRGAGKKIWDRLAQPITQEALVASLLPEYDVDEATCRSDVAAFVSDLADHGLVDVSDHEPLG